MNTTSVTTFFILLLGGCFTATTTQAGVAQQSWVFDVFLDDRPIGMHQFSITEQARGFTLTSEAAFDVSFLMIPVYRYRHRSEERWIDGCLTSLTAQTDDDGEQLSVSLQKEAQQNRLKTAQGEQTLQGCLRSFAYWDLQLLKSPSLLNAQNGELISVDLVLLGTDQLQIADRNIDSRQYRLAGKDAEGHSIDIQLWYSSQGEWLALKSITEDGYQLRYLRRELTQ